MESLSLLCSHCSLEGCQTVIFLVLCLILRLGEELSVVQTKFVSMLCGGIINMNAIKVINTSKENSKRKSKGERLYATENENIKKDYHCTNGS